MSNAKSSVVPSSTDIKGKKEGLSEVSVFHDHYAENIVFFLETTSFTHVQDSMKELKVC